MFNLRLLDVPAGVIASVTGDTEGDFSSFTRVRVTEILGTMFKLLAGAGGKLILLNAIPTSLFALMGIGMMAVATQLGGDTPLLYATWVVTILLFGVAQIGTMAGSFLILSEQARNGASHTGVIAAFRGGLSYFWNVVATGILMGLGLVLVCLPMVLLFAAPTPVVVISLMAVFVGVLLLKARWIAVWPAMVVERQFGTDALKRSWQLTTDRVGTVVVSMLFMFFIGVIVSLGTTLLAAIPVVGVLAGILGTALMVSIEYAFYQAAYQALSR